MYTGDIYRYLDSIIISPNDYAVFDIDGTLIDNSGLSIPNILAVYRYVQSKGIKNVIITARVGVEPNITYTIQQLLTLGVTGFHDIYFLPSGVYPSAAAQAEYKYHARKDLHDKGRNVVMSIGDMPWDIGAYGGMGFIVT